MDEIRVILPSYNERSNLEPVVRGILEQSPSARVLVVDDDSPDGTAAVAEQLAREGLPVRCLLRTGRRGYGSAVREGLQACMEDGAEAIVVMDADGSHDPRHLPALLEGLGRHAMMIGSRYVPEGRVAAWTPYRRWLSRMANHLTRLVTGLPVHDCTAGYRAYRREVLEAVSLSAIRSEGYAFLEELLFRVWQAGFSIGETPITFEDRVAGRSKLSRLEIVKAAWHLLRLRRRTRQPR